jgi:TolB-like protein/Tfp pilus assembly protein PilF
MVAIYIVTAWLVIQVSDVLFPGWDIPGEAIRYVLYAAIGGFPLAVVFSWRYDFTSSGIFLTPPAAESNHTDLSLRATDYALLAMLAAVFVGIAMESGRRIANSQILPDVAKSDPALLDSRSVAILPFTDDSAGQEDVAFLANGLHADLLSVMSRIANISVISRTAMIRYRGSDRLPRDIGKELGVGRVLEGQVRRAGNRMRVNVQLIDTVSNRSLWSEVYDRDLTAVDLFSIQTDIAKHIADSLRVQLTSAESDRIGSIPTENYEAYRAYLLGQQFADGGRIEEAVTQFRLAIELEPDFPQPYAGLARLSAGNAGGEETREILNTELFEMARKALALDDTLADARVAMAIAWRDGGDFEQATEQLRLALKHEPGNVWAIHNMALSLRMQGRLEEALLHYERAIKLNPLSLSLNESRASNLRDLSRFEESERQYRLTLFIDPDYDDAHWGLGTLEWSRGYPGKAIPWFNQAASLSPQQKAFATLSTLMNLELGRVNEAEALAQQSEVAGQDPMLIVRELLSIKAGQAPRDGPDFRVFLSRAYFGVLQDIPGRELLLGDYQAAIAHYRLEVSTEGDLDGVTYLDALHLAFALKETGNNSEAERLLVRVETFIKTIPRLGVRGYWLTDARVHAIRGDREQALDAITAAVDEGWRNLWWFYFDHDPVLAPLRSEAEFQAARLRVSADIAAQNAEYQAP